MKIAFLVSLSTSKILLSVVTYQMSKPFEKTFPTFHLESEDG